MNKIEFTFISLSHSIDMIFEFTESNNDFINNFMFLFAKKEDINNENRTATIQSQQKNSPELRAEVDKFIEHYKRLDIKVFQLRSYFQKLIEGEYFLIWPNGNLTSEQRTEFYNYLSSLRDGEDYQTVSEQMSDLFGELKNTYKIQAFDESTKRKIGEQDKAKRICRFCNNEREENTFKNIAHAISESLGNKKIILNEECDQCNSEFGSAQGIESSLITFLKFYGIFFGVKGKNGIPKIKGRNFELSNEGQIEIKHYADTDDDIDNEEDLTETKLQLDTYDSIIMQDIYKTLCKYALSVVDSNEIAKFQKTISWINGKTETTTLPKVAILTSYDFFKTHPSLIVYLRKDENTDLPYAVGELHYTFLTLVFIIPLAESDTKDFSEDENYENFWQFFKHYNSTENWNFRNFSDKTKRKFTLNLNFKQKDRSTNA